MVGKAIFLLFFIFFADGVRTDSVRTDSQDIPPWLTEIIANGTLYTAKILGAIYTPKSRNAKGLPPVAIGETVEVKNGSTSTKPKQATLLYRFGQEGGMGETVIQVWDIVEDPFIYFVAQRASGSKSYIEWGMTTPIWPELEGMEGFKGIKIKTYEHRKGNKMWDHYGFHDGLKQIVSDFPHKTLFFTGQSRGATMAEVLGFRYALAFGNKPGYKAPLVVSTGAYRWTNVDGLALNSQVLAGHFAHILLSRKTNVKTEFDFVSRVPPRYKGFADMLPAFHIDKATGIVNECVPSEGCPGDDPGITSLYGKMENYEELHKSIQVLHALKKSMRMLEGESSSLS